MLKFRTFIGTKTVKAAAMTKADAEKYLNRPIAPSTDSEDGYLVVYPDGYRSWSPAPVFDEAYTVAETPLDRMKIELAELTERMCKATKALYTPGCIPGEARDNLRRQLALMEDYAAVLYVRMRDFEAEITKGDE